VPVDRRKENCRAQVCCFFALATFAFASAAPAQMAWWPLRYSRKTSIAPRDMARRAYRNLVYFHEVDKGGHFAAWEQPELFAAELRAAFKSVRPAP
jgi:pimeloyl-ACP methyl ester carboxylesterase